jgi:hypothetical protein
LRQRRRAAHFEWIALQSVGRAHDRRKRLLVIERRPDKPVAADHRRSRAMADRHDRAHRMKRPQLAKRHFQPLLDTGRIEHEIALARCDTIVMFAPS